jgi:hypothetical protein
LQFGHQIRHTIVAGVLSALAPLLLARRRGRGMR